MAESVVMSLDIGTTSSRVVIYAADGTQVALAQREHRQYFPHPGWVEHDAGEIWQNIRELMALCLARSRYTASNIVAIGMTNQRETTVAWDVQTGRPVHRAIVWQDTRTDEMVARLAERSPRVRELSGLPVASYFSGLKMRWLWDHVPEVSQLAAEGRLLFGTIDSWILWNLTGRSTHATDITNASRTLLMNLLEGDWDRELIELLGLPVEETLAALPSIKPCSGHFGTVADGSGFTGIPITGILGDQQAAAFGQGIFHSGQVKNTYGTGCFVLHNTGTELVRSSHGLITTVAYHLQGDDVHYALEGSVAQAGSVVQWLRDQIGLIQTSEEIEELAATVADNGGVYFVPAFSGLFAPYWRSDARGTMIGLTSYATAGHIARAVLEATAFQTSDVLVAVSEDTGLDGPEVLRVDGGMTVNHDLMQFQADLLQIPVQRASDIETTARGAAFAAGLGGGLWIDHHEVSSLCQPGHEWTPNMNESDRQRLLAGWAQAIEHTIGWNPTKE
ncbi:glycerol kinase GlpK [Auritidibacter ignavus]|uniref:glycerol kinase GlpK n=1 Tax=Auritidibacter ignavus TaxID=678932 RepID=UPI00109D5755|nr:glycerol kinase GlpK [Auritidibacter ignavus]